MAVVVGSDASVFKRSASVATQTAFSLWGWFKFNSLRNGAFWGPLGIYAGTDGAPTNSTGDNAYQISSDASNANGVQDLGWWDSGGLFRSVTLFTAATGTWYFIAMTASGTSSGNLIAYVRALGTNTFTTASSNTATNTWTPGRAEWGRDGFSGDFIDGWVHGCGMANVALTADELLHASFTHEPHLAGIRSLNVFYPCIESVNTNAIVDRSGNARDATATVGALADGPSILWRPGVTQFMVPKASVVVGGVLVNPLSGRGGSAAQPLVVN